MTHQDLLAGPPPTQLPEDPAAAALADGAAPVDVVRDHPESPLAWASLAELALEDVAALPSDPAKADSPTFGKLIEEGKLPGGNAE